MQPLDNPSRDAPPDHAGVAFHPPILLVVGFHNLLENEARERRVGGLHG